MNLRIASANDVPLPDNSTIDVAVLDMNHGWPNIGHDAIVRAVENAGKKVGAEVRVFSYDVRRGAIPDPTAQRHDLYIGTGGPGHLDPRQNDGKGSWSQGIVEDPSWEPSLFRLFDAIVADEEKALIAVCHTFGVLCRWSSVATPVFRTPDQGGKSSGIRQNVLSPEGCAHPWFGRFAKVVDDGRHFSVIDNRLFDLVPVVGALSEKGFTAIAFEADSEGRPTDALTMIELARERDSPMPRIFAVNHHPEIIDRDYVHAVLEEKYRRGEVTREWYEERARTFDALYTEDIDRQVRLTAEYTFLGPLEFHVRRLAARHAPETATNNR